MKPTSDSALINTQPKNIPSPTPIRAPNTETTEASARTIQRVARRPNPTARSSPISRVRSNTDRAMVLVTPSIPISTVSASRGQDQVEQSIQLRLGAALHLFEGKNGHARQIRQQRLDGGLELVGGDSGRRFHIDLRI